MLFLNGDGAEQGRVGLRTDGGFTQPWTTVAVTVSPHNNMSVKPGQRQFSGFHWWRPFRDIVLEAVAVAFEGGDGGVVDEAG
jgi:hypothetical protein